MYSKHVTYKVMKQGLPVRTRSMPAFFAMKRLMTQEMVLRAAFAEKLNAIPGFLASVACSCLLLLNPGPSLSDEVIRFPASQDPKVLAAQQTLVETWQIVGDSFVDGQFNGVDWNEELRTHMLMAYNSSDADTAYKEISSMLDDLGDPYTRRISPQDYSNLLVSTEGELSGVGLLIANQPQNNHPVVVAPIKGGPAEKAGILPGDELVSINGEPVLGLGGKDITTQLRGSKGSEVRVVLVRYSNQIPGVAGLPEPKLVPEYKEVKLTRDVVELNPVFYTALKMDGKPDAKSTIGYIRLMGFTEHASHNIKEAVVDLKKQGASSFILDLRDNPGGLVQASMDIAAELLNGPSPVFSTVAREGAQEVYVQGHPITRDPMVVLVNHESASASEILSGALRDNKRALLMGDVRTYGKGRIQSVFELEDGSALSVTVAKYHTPAGSEIDLKGLIPDRACELPVGFDMVALPFIPTVPMDPSVKDAYIAQLANEKCVLAAEQVLSNQLAMPRAVHIAKNVASLH